jgi:signal transduction histidine kinase
LSATHVVACGDFSDRVFEKGVAVTNEALVISKEEPPSMNEELTSLSAERNLSVSADLATKWLTLLHDISLAIDQAPNWSEALRRVMGRICESEGWQVGYVYLPAADASDDLVPAISYFTHKRFAPFHLVSQRARPAIGRLLPGRVFADGHHIWINGEAELLKVIPDREAAAKLVGLQSAAALPVRVGNATLAVVELLSDRLHPESDELLSLMSDVSTQMGRVIERESITTQVSEIIWGEQQDLIQTLHDSLGQQLTGLGMLAASLDRRVRGLDKESARIARHIVSTTQEALERVRQLAKGLFQADIADHGFLEALRELASTTMSMHKVQCVVECDTEGINPSGRAATQLYRIAQEAVTNAVRHSRAAHITIHLQAEAGVTTLTVSDDGVGLHHRQSNENGIGLRIMRHRATSIGAVFSIAGGVDAGTVVKVVL